MGKTKKGKIAVGWSYRTFSFSSSFSRLLLIVDYELCRNVFGVDEKTYLGHMTSVKQSVLDGTSKWSAKIAITGGHTDWQRGDTALGRKWRLECGE